MWYAEQAGLVGQITASGIARSCQSLGLLFVMASC